ncbi:DUF3015 domain-containing protein [Leptospira ellisii]|uniref:DUF3015 domain-containing protein n=1 Tax=Leptospira ellisii TaxID=2023197 RepID=A0A2N0BDE5_9LEPT|nr:DUF3015 domain-containing protein [Leptospira ellisii]MDV6236520.1 DUF3015 domain-containing protein [Leptospira ellisii]PJZ94557.1 hypothetical protein CH379_02065 [Leptospira ellisii]PKA04701.1 hypothetical protein CH375_09380 [Leptospira ellisii]
MKKRVVSTVLCLAVLAGFGLTGKVEAKNYGMAGCGLGATVIKDNTVGSQLFAATLNATGVQTSGITSGTSNCTADGIVKSDKAQELFVTVNYQSLEQEMALGKGEKLDSFAKLLGCDAGSVSRFGKLTKDKYSSLIKQDTTPSLLLSAVKSEVKGDASLSKNCTL